MSIAHLLARLNAIDVKLRVENDELRISAPKGAISAELREELLKNKNEIIKSLCSASDVKQISTLPIARLEPREDYPLTHAQERLWLVSRLVDDASPYNLHYGLRLTGKINPHALERSLDQIVARHGSLRTTFTTVNGEPRQKVAQQLANFIKQVDLRDLRGSAKDRELGHLVREEMLQPFNLETGPLLRVILFRLGEDEYVFLVTMHHIISDGWSAGILFREFEKLYQDYNRDQVSTLPPLSLQYTDYAVWQRKVLSGEVLEVQLSYWREQLKDLSTLQLPTDHPRASTQTYRGAIIDRLLPPDVSEKLEAFSQNQGSTLFMTMLTAFNFLLHKYSGQDDIVVGTPVANRRQVELEKLIGFFVNMLVLRVDVSGDPTFCELLEKVKAVTLGAYEHQDLPFEKLVEDLQSERDLSRNPLFQVVFALQNAPLAQFNIEGVTLSGIQYKIETTRFDFEAHIFQGKEGLAIWFVYNPDLFESATVSRMLDHYLRILKEVAHNPDQRLSQLSILSQQEQKQLLLDLNQTETEYPRDSNLVEIFEARVADASNAVAVEYAGQVLSYVELNARANQLASYLRARGVGPEVMVGLFIERSVEMVIGILGIIKAGGAYVPLDLDYPKPRIAFMLEDAQLSVLLSMSSLQHRLPAFDGELICLDADWPAIEREKRDNLEVKSSAENLAYAFYTSGSTGQPKGVLVTHRAIIRLVCNTNYFQVHPSDRVAQASNVSFDAATFELWGALLNAAQLVGVSKEVLLRPKALSEFLSQQGITVLFVTTALFNLIARDKPQAFSDLRGLMFGGEAVDPEAVRRVVTLGSPERLLHVYGPTECTTFSTWYEVGDVPIAATTVPIGRPLANTTTYILDKNMNPVPIGVPGELYIGGDGLARGYLNRAELTEAKFVPNPFADKANQRLYRTGDIACYREDGAIDFIGRIDQQVKLRGFRIELGEIEAVLNRQPDIDSSLVIVREDVAGDKRLVAYLVTAIHKSPNLDELQSLLHETLPAFMVPAAFVFLDEIPLTSNGKVNKDVLPAPDVGSHLKASYIAPRNDMESKIADIWKEALKIEQVGIHDNFFSIGGNSLLLARVHENVQQIIEHNCPIIALFKYPSISTLAAYLSGELSATDKSAPIRDYRQKDNQPRGPIAIIGMSGRFPGARDVETFWSNLRDGVESITFSSDEELRQAGTAEALLEDDNFVGAASVLDDVDMFDAKFFGYSPRQAQVTNPQQRIFLECSWEVMERAGYNPDRYQGRVGVYGGVSTNNYDHALMNNPGLAESFNSLDAMIGNDKDFLATRVSYNLNLKGPGITLQTACSTSLVATHLAIQGLHERDCDMAIAGGSAIRSYQSKGYQYQEGGILSPDGHCRAFDANASGTIGGDGAAVVLLKRLDDALADGDQVYAIIKGSAINNDGSQKIGYTAPAVQGQAEVVAAAQAQADVDPRSISYIEAHGTGTPLGDPIEIEALTQVFQKQTQDKNFCAIGSLKTNVGHLDSAAGAAGLIKTALALWHKQIPPSLHYHSPNPEIDFDSNPFVVNTKLKPWNLDATPRRAGVSSFGIGGTNAHVVLEEAPVIEPSSEARPWQLLVFSAKSATALDSMTNNLHSYLQSDPDVNLADLAYTLQLGRKEFNYRRAVVCKDTTDAIAVLESRDPGRVIDSVVQDSDTPVVFMFTGQGAQYPDMGLQLYQYQSRYKEIVDQCCDILHVQLGFDLREVLFPSEVEITQAITRLNQTEITQAALFVTEYALASQWASWGIVPAAMIGHSIGEYVAACLSGVMSLDTALELVATRGRMMAQMPIGSMMAVHLSETELGSMLPNGLEIAAINNPQMCVVSGSDEAIDAFADQLDKKDLQTQKLHTSHAFHSAMMEPVLDPFSEIVDRFDLKPPLIPYISNVTGTWITDQQATQADYYSTQLRSTVRFADGLEQLFAERECLLLEIGPGHTLGSLAKHHPAKQDAHVVVSSLRHATEAIADESFMWQAIGRLWLAGVKLDWSAMRGLEQRHRLLLPTYPFERQRYWLEQHIPERPRQSLRRNDDPNEWIYVPSWRRAPLYSGQMDAATSSWLLFDDVHGPGAQVATRLEKCGADVIRIQVGKQFSRLSEKQFAINPARHEDYIQLIRELTNIAKLPSNIVHLWSATGPDETLTDEKNMVSILDHGFYSLLYLVQAIEAQGISDPIQLAVVTSSVYQVSGFDRLHPTAAMVLGPCKVIGMEHPHIICRNIDVEPVIEQQDISRLGQVLVTDLMAPSPESVVAYRGGYRWTQSYESIRTDAHLRENKLSPRPTLLTEAGVYLIIGGLGGLGLEMADYLARSVSAKLVLVGRSQLPERGLWQQWLTEHDKEDLVSSRINRVQALEAAGAEVLVCNADVANEKQMAEVFSLAETHFGSISGVIHAAGAAKHGMPISSITKEFCKQQFRPKLQGLMVLEKLLRKRDVDFCLVNSSLASVMGVTDFAAYTAAHIFMDSFVLQQSKSRKTGTRWITINWDNWATENINLDELLPGISKFLISPEKGAVALASAFSLLDTPQVVVSTGDLESRINLWTAREADVDATANKKTTFATLYDRPALDVDYEAPRTEVEQILTGIWQDMLGIKQVGIHDNFFDLGGDSVLNIQITAKASQSGLKLTPKQVFEFQTIAELAAVAKTIQDKQKQNRIAHGVVPLTPVQHWFFEQPNENPNHFNQAMLFQIPELLDVDLLQQVLEQLLVHHDALRARYSKNATGWSQYIAEACDRPVVQCFDLAGLGVEQQKKSIEANVAQIHRSLDLVHGPLLRSAYFDLGSNQAGRLLIVIHHLVIDVVSWRILLEDLEIAYRQIQNDSIVELPDRTTNLKLWSERLTDYALTNIPESEIKYWQTQTARQACLLPRDFSDGINNAGSTDTFNTCLTESETRLLLTSVPRIYKTRINEILLAALWRTLSRWTDNESVAVMLEGHGREAIIEDVDLSRTVGWFTTLFPVWFKFPTDIETGELIKTVKEQLRSIPSNGMGFGLLRYLSDKSDTKEIMAGIPIPEILFLYMGQFDQALDNNALLQPAPESPGPMQDPGLERQQLIDITAAISIGQLSVSWTYSHNRHKAETIQMLAVDYLNELRALIDHCKEIKRRDHTPSDFSATGLSQQDLAKITSKLKSKKAGAL